jgi:hypothetical protein
MITNINFSDPFKPNYSLTVTFGKSPNAKVLTGSICDMPYMDKISYTTRLKNLFASVKNFIINLKNLSNETTAEIANNNKFISHIQDRVRNKRFPLGEFEYSDFERLRITRDANGITALELRNTQNNKFIRSMLLDKDNTILEYKTSYPWKIFVKTDDGYRSCNNMDEYIKNIASDPMTSTEFIPRP